MVLIFYDKNKKLLNDTNKFKMNYPNLANYIL